MSSKRYHFILYDKIITNDLHIALPVVAHEIPVIFLEKTCSNSSLVVTSACCFKSSLPAVTPHASGLDMLALVGRPVAGFKPSQYSFLALEI